MISYRSKQMLIGGGLLVLVGLAVAWWFSAMEQKWQLQRRPLLAAARNPMLAASRWLELNQHPITLQRTLNDALRRPQRGVLLLGDSSGTLGEEQARQLLDWVRAGNTLIMRPVQADDYEAEDDEAADGQDQAPAAASAAAASAAAASAAAASTGDASAATASGVTAQASASVAVVAPAPEVQAADPVSRHFGIGLLARPAAPAQQCPRPEEPAAVILPGQNYPLQLESGWLRLHASGSGPRPLYRDGSGAALQVFAEGAGRVVLLSAAPFSNDTLGHYDHAELLLALTRLQQPRAPVVLVENLDVPRWYVLLWQRFAPAILTLAAGLLLLLWAAVRRFGPLLPEAASERRALIEHIDASARWLWKLPAGRTQLLQAARAPVLALLERRLPALARLPDARVRLLAEECGLSESQVRLALQDPPASLPGEFTRQIQLLQGLRTHYER